jgi:hypothetical protein
MSKSVSVFVSAVVFMIAAEAGAAQVYKCEGMGDNKGNQVTLTVVSSTEVKVDEDFAKLDTTYNPRLNHGFSRFEYLQSEEGTTEVLVQDVLLDGASKGLIKVQNRGEGFGSSSYYCHP